MLSNRDCRRRCFAVVLSVTGLILVNPATNFFSANLGAASHASKYPHSSSPSGPASAALAVLVALSGNAPAVLANAPGKWTYSEKGADWGGEFPLCKGKMQTPIDVKEADVKATRGESLFKYLKYRKVDTQLENVGLKTVQMTGNFGVFKLPDGDYEVKQVHFHFPSEHEIEGKLAAGEMHIVHQKPGSPGLDDLAVVSLFLKESDASEGPEGKFLRKLGFGTTLPAGDGQKFPVPQMNLNAFAAEFGGGFYHYRGSLTTPPCAETVHWYLLKKAAPVTKAMVDSFKARFPPNNREIRPLNNRPIIASARALPQEFNCGITIKCTS